jgi:hypothetical protein
MNASELVEKIELNYSKRGIERIAQECIDSPETLNVLIKNILKGKPREAQLASWVLSKVVDLNPSCISSYHKKLLDLIHPATAASVKRNIIRTFSFVELEEDLHAQLINTCFETLHNPNYSIAERAFSLHVLGKYTKEYPELWNELIPIIERGMPHESAAFRSIGGKLLRKFLRTKST